MKYKSCFTCLLVFFIFPVFWGCSNKKPALVLIPELLKEYSVFNVGSFWIFKNEMNGKSDSSFIQVPPRFIPGGYGEDDPNIETCYVTYGGAFMAGAAIDPNICSINFVNRLNGNCLEYYNHPQENNDWHFKIIQNLDSVTINQIVYYNVLNTQYKATASPGDTMTFTFYLAKSIGLIKFNLHGNDRDTTWSLLRYHVVL